MRICLLSYRGSMFCGGQGIYLWHLAKALAGLGHEIHVLVGPPLADDMPWATVHVIENHNFFSADEGWLPEDAPLDIFKPLNLFEFTATRFGLFPEMLAFSFRAFKKLLELKKAGILFDVIHDNQGLGYGMILMKSLGPPVLSTIHHPLTIDRKESFWQLAGLKAKAKKIVYYPPIMQKIVTRRLDKVITVSKISAEANYEAYGIRPEDQAVIYNGVDTQMFSPSENGHENTGKKLVFVGNTEDRKKGVKYLLKAMTMLPDDFTLTLVNGGAPRHIYSEGLVKEFGIENRVRFTGRLHIKEVAEAYRSADICVVPSLFEGFGFPAAEAMACGLAVVSTTGGALPEVVGEDGKAALVVEPRSSTAIANAIKKLADDAELRERLGKAARERILKLFTWKKAAEEVVEVYNRAIEDKRSQ